VIPAPKTNSNTSPYSAMSKLMGVSVLALAHLALSFDTDSCSDTHMQHHSEQDGGQDYLQQEKIVSREPSSLLQTQNAMHRSLMPVHEHSTSMSEIPVEAVEILVEAKKVASHGPSSLLQQDVTRHRSLIPDLSNGSILSELPVEAKPGNANPYVAMPIGWVATESSPPHEADNDAVGDALDSARRGNDYMGAGYPSLGDVNASDLPDNDDTFKPGILIDGNGSDMQMQEATRAAQSYERRLRKLGALGIRNVASEEHSRENQMQQSISEGTKAQENAGHNMSQEGAEAASAHANQTQNGSLQGSANAALAHQAAEAISVHSDATQNVSLQARAEDISGMNAMDTFDATKPHGKKKKDNEESEDSHKKELKELNGLDGKKGSADLHTLEQDYRDRATMAKTGMMGKYGIHPYQAFGFVFLVCMFSYWFNKIYKEHYDNTW